MPTTKKALRLTKYGFKRSKEDNFSDDGNYFYGYRFEGVRVSYLRFGDIENDEIFLSVKVYEDEKLKDLDSKFFEKYNGVKMSEFKEEEFAKWVEEMREKIASARA